MDEISKIWSDDLLGRREEADALITFLTRRHEEHIKEGRKHSYVINLDGGWGQGKTFFVERLEKQLQHQGYLTASVNSWRDDATGEPMVAVMGAIEQALKPLFKANSDLNDLWRKTKVAAGPVMIAVLTGAMKKLASKVRGDGIGDIERELDKVDLDLDDVVDDDDAEKLAEKAGEKVSSLLDKFLSKKLKDYERNLKSSAAFKVRLSKLLNAVNGESPKPFFVFIDELDRCRPTYAIELLEQSKHIFDIPEIIFIISTDHEQLSQAIGAVYGEKFDGSRYLRRFFSRRFNLLNPSMGNYSKYLFGHNGIDLDIFAVPSSIDAVDVFSSAMLNFGMTLRDAEQCFDLLKCFCTTWSHKSKIQIICLISMIVMFHKKDITNFSEILNWKGREIIGKLGDKWTLRQANTQLSPDFLNEYGEIDLIEIIDVLYSFAKRPVIEICQSHGSGVLINWCRRQFVDELTADGSSVNPDLGIDCSIITGYPDRIKSVARLRVE